MWQFIARRLAWTLVVLFGVSLITFTIVYIVPADVAAMMAGPRASPEVKAQITRDLGLDQPLYAQYWRYLGNLLRGDLGSSWMYRQAVTEAIGQHLPYTASLALAGAVVELALGLPVGLISAVRQHSWLDRVLMLFSLVSISAPPFWVGLMLLYLLAVRLPIFPVGGYGSLLHLVLPALTLGLSGGAWYARVFRSSMLDQLHADYVRTARAKGLRPLAATLRHVVPNSLIPVITMFGLDLGTFLGGVVVVEPVFGWPGIGMQAWKAIRDVDVPVLMGTILMAALAMTLINLLVEVCYAFVDPRIRYG
jgi:peptide/nickel transport system permease protein